MRGIATGVRGPSSTACICLMIGATVVVRDVGKQAFATTPVVVHGVVYVQDLGSNVLAIRLAIGKVLCRHVYRSPNGGPDGVTVADGDLYGATNHAVFAPRSWDEVQDLWGKPAINSGGGQWYPPSFDAEGNIYLRAPQRTI